MTKRLLIIEDDEFLQELIDRVAKEMGFETQSIRSLSPDCVGLLESDPDLVLLDLKIPGADGVEVLRAFAEHQFHSPIVLMSGVDTRTLKAARRIGCEHGLNMADTLTKPFGRRKLQATLHSALSMSNMIGPDDLERGIDRGELRLVYQPKRCSKTNRPVGVESLVRWHHPRLGVLAPLRFIGMAEESGLMYRLTDWVLETALRQLKEWELAGIQLTMAINVSSTNLRNPGFPDRCSELVTELELQDPRLILEVTERRAITLDLLTTEVLARLRLRNIELSVDDCGTGFSSLRLLKRLPFSELKIDRSFVKDIVRDRDAWLITRAIVELGHALGLRVVAEGVEDDDTESVLREFGCDQLQGYSIALPMGADCVPAWWASVCDTPASPSNSGSGRVANC